MNQGFATCFFIRNMDCELCDLVINRKIVTRHYYTNKTITIVDCRTCLVPMVVFNHHGQATEEERRLAMNVIDQLFDYESIRKTPRKIGDHEHWHLMGAKLK